MNPPTVGSIDKFSSDEKEVRALYERLIAGWNERSAEGMAAPFAPDGMLIGFDGSQAAGRDVIVSHLQPIFSSHPTPPYVTIVRSVRLIGAEAAVLRAVAGMVPPGKPTLIRRSMRFRPLSPRSATANGASSCFKRRRHNSTEGRNWWRN